MKIFNQETLQEALALLNEQLIQRETKQTYGDIFVGGRNYIFVSSAIAKNGDARYIYPAACVKSWFEYAKAKELHLDPKDYLIPGETRKQRKTAHSSFLKTQASETGIVLPKNCIRHTAASFMSESIGYTAAANQLGHDLAVLMKHYRRAITKTEAEEFYNITPDSV